MKDVLTRFRSDQRSEPETLPPDLPTRLIRFLPWIGFCFFYFPLIYWSGWGLKASQVIDYPGYYLAAHNVFIDHTSPYGFDAFDAYAYALGRWIPPYVYPPPSILAFWPLVFFSLKNAFVVFTLISHLCLLGSMWLILTRLMRLPRDTAARRVFVGVCIIYMLCSDAVPTTLNLGQVNLIVLFLICLSLVALQEGASDWRIAAPLSVAILLKTYPVFLVILLVARRRFKAAALSLGYVGALVAISVVVVPRYVWASWLAEVVPAASSTKAMNLLFSHTPLDFTWNQSIAGFVKRLLGDAIWGKPPLFLPRLAAPLATILNAFVIIVTSVVTFRFCRRTASVASVADDIAVFLPMMYLVAPLSWDHHLVFVLPSAIFALALILNGTMRGKRAVALAAVLCVLAWRFPLDAPLFKKSWWFLFGFVKLYAVAALWTFFAVRLARGSSIALKESTAPVLAERLQPQF